MRPGSHSMEAAGLRLAPASLSCALFGDTCAFLATCTSLVPRPRAATKSSEVLSGFMAAPTLSQASFFLADAERASHRPAPPLGARSGLERRRRRRPVPGGRWGEAPAVTPGGFQAGSRDPRQLGAAAELGPQSPAYGNPESRG